MHNNNIDRDIFMCISLGIAVFVVGFSKCLVASPCWNYSIPGLAFLFWLFLQRHPPFLLRFTTFKGVLLRHVANHYFVSRVDSVAENDVTQLGCGRRGQPNSK